MCVIVPSAHRILEQKQAIAVNKVAVGKKHDVGWGEPRKMGPMRALMYATCWGTTSPTKSKRRDSY